jgi:hypothetical protein
MGVVGALLLCAIPTQNHGLPNRRFAWFVVCSLSLVFFVPEIMEAAKAPRLEVVLTGGVSGNAFWALLSLLCAAVIDEQPMAVPQLAR